MDEETREYLLARLERIKELILEGNNHMAIAKINADISALKSGKVYSYTTVRNISG